VRAAVSGIPNPYVSLIVVRTGEGRIPVDTERDFGSIGGIELDAALAPSGETRFRIERKGQIVYATQVAALSLLQSAPRSDVVISGQRCFYFGGTSCNWL
jgi:hypothetical protein